MSTPIDLRNVIVDDKFWKHEMELVRTEVIPYQWNALNDNVPGAAPSYCMHNYKVAGKLNEARMKYGNDYKKATKMPFLWGANPDDPNDLKDEFYGYVFQDSDFSKWVEAVAYSLTQHPDATLEKTADEAIDIVCKAQLPNGYLDTYYIISDIDKAFSNLRECHELYCFGHLTEGAVAYYQATGKDKLLKTAMKYADYISTIFGAEPGKKKGYPGHEIAEMALVRLYEVTKEEKYLELSKFFVNERGKRPYYFDSEESVNIPKGHENDERYAYNQAHKPVREMDEAVGHAVRAVYLYSGMTDVARLTGDEELLRACEKIWDNIVGKKMYITGGIGATHLGEAFSFNYDLPNDTAYSETCAAIGLVFFARRMLEIKADRKYSDVMELALYNGVLSGMAMDGKSFFYVNPLEVNPEACLKDERKFHVKHVRQKWFGCACCPPNIARLLSSVVSYAYTEDDKTLYTHLYIGGTVTKKFGDREVTFKVTSGFPWNGKVMIEAQSAEGTNGTLALRIPGWCKKKVKIEGAVEKDGYLYINKDWTKGDKVELDLEMAPVLIKANNNVREDAGRLCVKRGPIVYCLEEIDNGKHLHNLYINPEETLETVTKEIHGMNMTCVEAGGQRIMDESESAPLYEEYKESDRKPCKLTFVPYWAWNNRGEGEMSVWVNKL